MTETKKSWWIRFEAWLVKTVFIAPWYIIVFFFRLIYRFRIENPEKLPREAPFILTLKEPSIVAIFSTGNVAIKVLLPQISKHPSVPTVAYMMDRLFENQYINYINAILERYGWDVKLRGLIPHSAGMMALDLLEGLRALNKGGVAMLNPEGASRWDGLPITIGQSLAWLGLHSAAPIYPALCTIGAFDIWPSWRKRPYLNGDLSIKVGEPFKLTEEPIDQITNADLQAANERIYEIYEKIAYGDEGVKGWAGPVRKNGEVVDENIELKRPQTLIPQDQWTFNYKKDESIQRGIGLLLWRCPVCKSNDSIVHRDSWFGKGEVNCQACGTKWEVKRIFSHDFRLAVIDGDPELLGLDMPLSLWYEKMKEGFSPEPIAIKDEELREGELFYMENDRFQLLVNTPSYLFDGWEEKEAPASKPRGGSKYGVWEDFGRGKILLSDQRLIWRNQGRELYFNWSTVTAVHHLPGPFSLGINYGSARYQFPLGNEAGLKWLTYIGSIIKKAADLDGHKCTFSPY